MFDVSRLRRLILGLAIRAFLMAHSIQPRAYGVLLIPRELERLRRPWLSLVIVPRSLKLRLAVPSDATQSLRDVCRRLARPPQADHRFTEERFRALSHSSSIRFLVSALDGSIAA